MGWFKPEPMELKYGEPVHQMVARAFMRGSIHINDDILACAKYHFVGPHGIVYKGSDKLWRRQPSCYARAVAQLCEEIQRDFNERIAGIEAARKHAVEKGSVAPLFVSAHTGDA